MVYVDELYDYGWRLGPSCHLIADTLEELHTFAAGIGMKRSWFQISKSGCLHYDLTARRRELAIKMGAIKLGRHAFVDKIKTHAIQKS
jgi:hypothetical protein